MKQLSGLDAAFVHQNTYRTPMHITVLLIYDIGERREHTFSKQQLVELISSKLDSIPVFRRRLHSLPMGIDTPCWAEDTTPDLNMHVHQQSFSGSVEWPNFFKLVNRVHERSLNMKVPLWELHLIKGIEGLQGLPRNCEAIALKIHHAAIDGVALAAIIHALHDSSIAEPATQWQAVSAPGRWDLLSRANSNLYKRNRKLGKTVSTLLPAFLKTRETKERDDSLAPILRGKAHFNGRVSRHRSTGAIIMEQCDLLAIRRAVRRVTPNDIALAIVAGALRKYLSHHELLPQQTLGCGVPISLRAKGAQQQDPEGNNIATMIVGLATNEGDPVQRLRTIHQYAVAGKKRINAVGTGTVMDISDSLNPGVLAEGIKALALASQIVDIPVPFHVMVSNVPGPTTAMHLRGAKLVVPMGMGPVRDNMGLFHIVSSSSEKVSIGFNACQKLLPDPEYYQECLTESYTELLEKALSDTSD